MKISVLGAGAIGSMLGGLIRHYRPDWDVRLITRGEHGRVLATRGTVLLDGPWGTYTVPIRSSDQVEDIAGSDLVLLTVKSQATEEAIRSASDHLGEAVVVSIQNGINDAVLTSYVAPERLVMGMTATNMELVEPGRVSLQLDGLTLVGPHADGSNQQAARQAQQVLRESRLAVELDEQLLGVRYQKLCMNALGYASCLSASNLITDALGCREWRRYVARPIVDECLEVFTAAGIELVQIKGRPNLQGLRRFLSSLEIPLLGRLVYFVARRIYNRKPIVFSLYQDLRRGKPTEVDYINGEVVRLANACGREAPYNRLVIELVRQLEARGNGTFFTRDEVIERFQQLTSQSARSQPDEFAGRRVAESSRRA